MLISTVFLLYFDQLFSGLIFFFLFMVQITLKSQTLDFPLSFGTRARSGCWASAVGHLHMSLLRSVSNMKYLFVADCVIVTNHSIMHY